MKKLLICFGIVFILLLSNVSAEAMKKVDGQLCYKKLTINTKTYFQYALWTTRNGTWGQFTPMSGEEATRIIKYVILKAKNNLVCETGTIKVKQSICSSYNLTCY